MDLFNRNRRESNSKLTKDQFVLQGNLELIQLIQADDFSTNILQDERIYIDKGKAPINRVTVTPEKDIEGSEQLGKHLSILRRIEQHTKSYK